MVSRNTRLVLTVLAVTPTMPGASEAVSIFRSGQNPEPNPCSCFELQHSKSGGIVLEHYLNDHWVKKPVLLE